MNFFTISVQRNTISRQNQNKFVLRWWGKGTLSLVKGLITEDGVCHCGVVWFEDKRKRAGSEHVSEPKVPPAPPPLAPVPSNRFTNCFAFRHI